MYLFLASEKEINNFDSNNTSHHQRFSNINISYWGIIIWGLISGLFSLPTPDDD